MLRRIEVAAIVAAEKRDKISTILNIFFNL